mmetsp:Transcript_2555/g.5495  ORF Transcript_2555/g.5495 Transcript_2555/m.5495 type:complete len:90 (+) Transcript_2555:1467-1736(+)
MVGAESKADQMMFLSDKALGCFLSITSNTNAYRFVFRSIHPFCCITATRTPKKIRSEGKRMLRENEDAEIKFLNQRLLTWGVFIAYFHE